MQIKSELFNKTKRYFSYKRSAGRVEYFVCFATASLILVLAKDSFTSNSLSSFAFDPTGLLKFLNFPFVAVPFYLISIILFVTVTIRRLRYLSLSLWWALLWVPMVIGLMPYWTLMFLVLLLLISNEDEPIFSVIKNKAISSEMKASSSTKNTSKPEVNMTSNFNINLKDIVKAVKIYFIRIFLHSKHRKIYVSIFSMLIWFFIINFNGTMSTYENIRYDLMVRDVLIFELFGNSIYRGYIFDVPIIILAVVYGKNFLGVLKHEAKILKNFKEKPFLALSPIFISTVIATLLIVFNYDYRIGFVWFDYYYVTMVFRWPWYAIAICFFSNLIFWTAITFALPSQLRRLLAKRQDMSSS